MLFGTYVAKGTVRLDKSLAQMGIDDIGGLTPQEREATIRDLLTARSGVYHVASNPVATSTTRSRATSRVRLAWRTSIEPRSGRWEIRRARCTSPTTCSSRRATWRALGISCCAGATGKAANSFRGIGWRSQRSRPPGDGDAPQLLPSGSVRLRLSMVGLGRCSRDRTVSRRLHRARRDRSVHHRAARGEPGDRAQDAARPGKGHAAHRVPRR
jgi:hypothetical protein